MFQDGISNVLCVESQPPRGRSTIWYYIEESSLCNNNFDSRSERVHSKNAAFPETNPFHLQKQFLGWHIFSHDF